MKPSGLPLGPSAGAAVSTAGATVGGFGGATTGASAGDCMPPTKDKRRCATASAAHLAASWPYPLLEGPFAVGVSGALADDYAVEPIRPDGNLIHVPEGPGLGIELDEDKLKKYRIDV